MGDAGERHTCDPGHLLLGEKLSSDVLAPFGVLATRVVGLDLAENEGLELFPTVLSTFLKGVAALSVDIFLCS